MCIDLHKRLKRLLIAVIAMGAVSVGSVIAQEVESPESWQELEAIDEIMGELHGPVWQPVYFTPSHIPGASTGSPIYKQQPFGAQQDFRPLTPGPVVAPGSGGTGGPGSGSSPGSGSGSGGSPDPVPCTIENAEECFF